MASLRFPIPGGCKPLTRAPLSRVTQPARAPPRPPSVGSHTQGRASPAPQSPGNGSACHCWAPLRHLPLGTPVKALTPVPPPLCLRTSLRPLLLGASRHWAWSPDPLAWWHFTFPSVLCALQRPPDRLQALGGVLSSPCDFPWSRLCFLLGRLRDEPHTSCEFGDAARR